jgi:hypothetical protein
MNRIGRCKLSANRAPFNHPTTENLCIFSLSCLQTKYYEKTMNLAANEMHREPKEGLLLTVLEA